MAARGHHRSFGRRVLLCLSALTLTATSGCATPAHTMSAQDKAAIRAAETQRLRALVTRDIATAERLHAQDFQVVNPLGRFLSREAYLGSIASGESDYLTWDAGEIDVRLHGALAVIRYKSRVELVVRGRKLPPIQAWNTGVYERKSGRWAIVWFQVTEITPPPR